LQWIKTFGGSGNDFFYTAISLPDSSCIVGGGTTSRDGDGNPLGNSDAWIVKLDKNGNIIWKKFPLTTGTNDIKSTADGNFILCGGNTISKIDTSGNLIWKKTYSGGLYNIEKAGNNGYIVAGTSFATPGIADGYALRIDENGNVLWQKSVGGTLQDEIRHVTVMPDNSFVFDGYSTSSDGDVPFNHGLTDGFAFALDGNGTLLWTKSYGGNGRDEFWGVTSGNDGSVILSGFTGLKDGNTSTSPQKWDFVMLKLREKTTTTIDTFSCKPFFINNILITHDTTVTDSLKDICNYDSAYIKYNITMRSETVHTINDVTANFGERITLTTTASGPVTWSGAGLSCYNCLSPIAFPSNIINTYVVQTGSGNCKVTDTVIIIVKSTDTLYVPSAFTPNGDGKNDFFNGLGIVSDYSMEIFNRWGQLIFNTNSLLTGWDGTYKGVAQPTGSFVYLIRYKTKANVLKQQKGIITLIR
jgi:gliding motility-associated-like protein